MAPATASSRRTIVAATRRVNSNAKTRAEYQRRGARISYWIVCFKLVDRVPRPRLCVGVRIRLTFEDAHAEAWAWHPEDGTRVNGVGWPPVSSPRELMTDGDAYAEESCTGSVKKYGSRLGYQTAIALAGQSPRQRHPINQFEADDQLHVALDMTTSCSHNRLHDVVTQRKQVFSCRHVRPPSPLCLPHSRS
jgi:hypothetical protein